MHSHPSAPSVASLHRPGALASRAAALLLLAAAAPELAAQLVYPTVVLKSTTELPAADGAANDRYGQSVAIDGDRALIGASADDDTFATSGSVYVRDRNFGGPGAWGQSAKLHASDPESGAQFGTAVGIDGGWIVATAPFATIAGQPGVGAAYILSNPGLAPLHKVAPAAGLMNQHYGNAVAVDAAMGQALIGSADWWGGVTPSTFKGSAYVVDLASGTQLHALVGNSTNNEQFGLSVDLGAGYYAVGAPGNASNKGAVFVFSAGSGALLHKIVPADALGNDRFGSSLSIDGGLIAIGSPGNDGFIFNTGAIYIYDLASGALVNKVGPTFTDAGPIGLAVALRGQEVFTGQSGTGLSGGLQTCGSVQQLRWDYGYTVAVLTPNALGGLCTDQIGFNLAEDAGTLFTGDAVNGVGLVPTSGTAWTLQRLPLALAADKKITIAANPLNFTVRAGEPGLPCVLGVVALNGVPLAVPAVLAAGSANATGQWTKSYPSTTATAVTVTFAAAAFDASSNLVFSNTVDVQFL